MKTNATVGKNGGVDGLLDMIKGHMNTVALVDQRYVCECGQIKNRDNLNDISSGTQCASCPISKDAIPYSINNFTTAVKKMQTFLSEKESSPTKQNNNIENIQKDKTKITPSKSKKNNLEKDKKTDQIHINNNNNIIKTNATVQTDLSFNINDNVTFNINKSNNNNNIFKDISKDNINKQNSQTKNVEFKQNSQTKYDKFKQSKNDAFKQNSQTKNDKFKQSKNDEFKQNSQSKNDEYKQNSQTKNDKFKQSKNDEFNQNSEKNTYNNIEETEVIGSSIDDYNFQQQQQYNHEDDQEYNQKSPLVFTPENQEIESEIIEENDDDDDDEDDWVDATPEKTQNNIIEKNNIININNNESMMVSENNINENTTKLISNNIEMNEDMDDDDDDNDIIETKEMVHKNNINTSNILNMEEDEINEAITQKYNNKNKMFNNNKNINYMELDETNETIITQYNKINIVTSNIEDEDFIDLNDFIKIFNPNIENDVTEDTNFVLVGVDKDNKVIRKTPKYYKAIATHTCIININYIKLCNIKKDLVDIEKKFIPFDTTGTYGPLKSYLNTDLKLLNNYVIYSLEKTVSFYSIIEFLVIKSGAVMLKSKKLFNDYRDEKYNKIILYGEYEEENITHDLRSKMLENNIHLVHNKSFFHCIDIYDDLLKVHSIESTL